MPFDPDNKIFLPDEFDVGRICRKHLRVSCDECSKLVRQEIKK